MDPYLLIIMRNDMTSMSPGRAAAQASHATSRFTMLAEHPKRTHSWDNDYLAWKESTPQDFGTAIVVAASGGELDYLIKKAKKLMFLAETIIDPDYSLRDGNTVHHLNIPTCGFIFMDTNSNLRHASRDNFIQETKFLPLF